MCFYSGLKMYLGKLMRFTVLLIEGSFQKRTISVAFNEP